MRQSSTVNTLFDRIFARLSPEIAATFTSEQIEGLRRAIDKLSWKRHAVDLRLSVPFPGRSFYLVILAGPEHRSRRRLRAEKRRYPIWTPTNILVLAVVAGLLVLSLLGILQFFLPTLTSLNLSEPHPTAIPYIQNEAECLRGDKIWNDGQCWDFQHSPFF
jgi:hypothetical protein